MIFINTRPAERAHVLTESLRQQGVTVVDLPLLALVACELSQTDKQNLTNINSYQAILFVSETAVRYFVDFVKNNAINLSNIPIIAVGKKTADVFLQYWQQNFQYLPNLITPSQYHLPENNEGMLQLPMIKNLQKNDKLFICKGKDGRDLLKNHLQQQGVMIKSVDFYQRIFPKNSEIIFVNHVQSWQANQQKPIVLISSLTAWQHWQQLLNKFAVLLNDFVYLVLQQRIANQLMQQHIQQMVVIDSLSLTMINNGLQKLQSQ